MCANPAKSLVLIIGKKKRVALAERQLMKIAQSESRIVANTEGSQQTNFRRIALVGLGQQEESRLAGGTRGVPGRRGEAPWCSGRPYQGRDPTSTLPPPQDHYLTPQWCDGIVGEASGRTLLGRFGPFPNHGFPKNFGTYVDRGIRKHSTSSLAMLCCLENDGGDDVEGPPVRPWLVEDSTERHD